MESTPERRRRWWKRWWFWVGIVPLGLVLLTGIAAERTSRSQFCVTCHYMQPFYDSWTTSTHKNVECIMCHFDPTLEGTIRGKLQGLYQVVSYVSSMYKRSRPWAEIDDASCLRSGCHSVDILADTTVVMFRGVKFQHGAHLRHSRRGKQLRCTSCHSQIVQGDHMVVTPSTCMLCHMRAGGVLSATSQHGERNGCLVCHLQPGGEHASTHPRLEGLKVQCTQCHGTMVSGDGAVEHERCFACHWESERLAKVDDHELVHRVHITEHKIECLNCHSLIQHKTIAAATVTSLDCQGCHPRLHEPQHTLFTGSGAHGLPAMPNPMFARGIQCQSCHVYHQAVEFPELGQSVRASALVCEECHGRGFTGLLATWSSTTRRHTVALRTMEREVRGRAGRAPNQAIAVLLDSIDYNLAVVEKGRPVHNMVYATAILDTNYRLLRRAAAAVSPPVHLPAFHAGADGKIPTECSACHVAAKRELVMAFGEIPFSHEMHVNRQGLPCTMCHSNTRVHGERVIDRAGCAACHHRPQNSAACGPCHATQRNLFVGSSVLFEGKPAPESNLHAEQPCRGCHGGVGRPVAKAGPRSCLNCHEPGYEETYEEWQSETRETIANVRGALRRVDEGKLSEVQRDRYRLATEAVDALVADRSWGVHNAERAQGILERVASIAEELPQQPVP